MTVDTDPQVTDNQVAHRFEIEVDGHIAGFAEYVIRDNTYVFTHTEVDPSYKGQGLASALVRSALDQVREQGASVIPQCPFVRNYIARHEEYADLIAAA